MTLYSINYNSRATLRPAIIYICYQSCYSTKLYLLWEKVKIALRQNFTKTNLHEMTKFHNLNFSPTVNFERRYFCSQTKLLKVRVLNFTKTNLHERTKLHKDNIASRVNFARRYFFNKTNLYEGKKLNKDNFAPRVNFARRQICTKGLSCTRGKGVKALRVNSTKKGTIPN